MPKDIYTEYIALPGHEQRITQMIRALAEYAAGEPRILRFQPYTHDANPRKYFVLETYLNEEAFEDHFTSVARLRFTEEMRLHIVDQAPAMARLTSIH